MMNIKYASDQQKREHLWLCHLGQQ